MSTRSDLIDALEDLKSRATTQFTATGWAMDSILMKTQGWNHPAYTMSQLIDYIDITISRANGINEGYFDNDSVKAKIEDFIKSLQSQAVVNVTSDSDNVMGSFATLLQLVNAQIPNPRQPSPKVDWEDIKDKGTVPKDLSRRLRSVASRLQLLEPQSEQLAAKIAEIEAAHEAAERLPTDLEELASQREALQSIIESAQTLASELASIGNRSADESRNSALKIASMAEEVESRDKLIDAQLTKAENLIAASEQALRGSTGVGLANAFENRKDSLTLAAYIWVGGLAVSLITALVIGHDRVTALRDVLNGSQSPTVVWVNTLLAVLGIGAPVWFAWLSTKQIWTNFRLAEDYAFKSSVSKAYEGYRKEAIDLDPEMRQRLFATALTRIEEAPIRLMDQQVHSSPLQEMLANPTVVKAMESVPDMASKIMALIKNKDAVPTAAVGAAIAATAAIASPEGTITARKQSEKAVENE